MAGAAPPYRVDELEGLIPKIRQRNPRAVGRALSVVEGGGESGRTLVHLLHPYLGGARLLGVTGPPGAGKSTLVDRLTRELREGGDTVAVIAVDPSSPFSGGALLGDRIRMQALYTDPGVFIRSMATRGAMGGLAGATHDAIDVLSAAGFDWIVVETVGVGQDEIDIVRTVETVLVVTLPGLGDEIQAIKAGLMEIADVFVINKADREGVEHTSADLQLMLELTESDGWSPPIVKTIAVRDEGTQEVLEAVKRHRLWMQKSGGLAARAETRFRRRVESILQREILASAGALLDQDELKDSIESSPYEIAERVFETIRGRIFSTGGFAG